MTYFPFFFVVTVILQRLYEMKRHRKEKGTVSSPGTLAAMAAVHAFCFVAAPVEFMLRGHQGNSIAVSGLVIFTAGFILRRWVIHTLGRYWSVHIEIREHQPLITWGPFSWCRHPNYLAILLEVTGYCLVFSAWVTGSVSLLIYFPVLRGRIQREEEVLTRFFGYRYREYESRTPALIPGMPSKEKVV